MEQNLDKFMNYVKILNKEFSIYEDLEKGIIINFNTVHLLARLDYLELDKAEYELAKFQKKIEDLDYNEIKTKKAVPKNEITKNDKDKYTIIDKEVFAKQIWNVSNALGSFKSFVNKEEAIEYTHKINDLVSSKLL